MDGYLLEFLIQSANGGWFTNPNEQELDCSIFQPLDFASILLEQREVCCIQVENCEICFSDEIVGVQVSVETSEVSEEMIDNIIQSITNHLGAVTGQPTIVHRL